MSVDVYVQTDGCCAAHDHQFTYNYTPALREMGFPAWKFFDGLPAWVVSKFVERLLTEMPEAKQRAEPLIKGAGSWGTWGSLTEALMSFEADLVRHPEGTVNVS